MNFLDIIYLMLLSAAIAFIFVFALSRDKKR